jgi:class 3 adenylate cyclase
MAGFTSISEKLDPERLAQFMKEYLGIISEEVLAQEERSISMSAMRWCVLE